MDEDISKPTKSWNDVTIQTNGTDRKYGNLVGIQLVLQPKDFVKEEWWRERIEETFKKEKPPEFLIVKRLLFFLNILEQAYYSWMKNPNF